MFLQVPGAAWKGNSVKVEQAYRSALDPSPAQELALRSHARAARFAWNWALGNCRERYAVERKWYSGAELHRLWNQAKKADPELAWWDAVSANEHATATATIFGMTWATEVEHGCAAQG
jgi:putative transposase